MDADCDCPLSVSDLLMTIGVVYVPSGTTTVSPALAESINCCVTSPRYWGLRDYGIEPVIWDGDKDCEHEWQGNNTKISGGGYSDKSTLQGFSNLNTKGRQMDRDIENTINNALCLKCGAWRGSLGLEPERCAMKQVAITDFHKVPEMVQAFVDEVVEMGPNPCKGF